MLDHWPLFWNAIRHPLANTLSYGFQFTMDILAGMTLRSSSFVSAPPRPALRRAPRQSGTLAGLAMVFGLFWVTGSLYYLFPEWAHPMTAASIAWPDVAMTWTVLALSRRGQPSRAGSTGWVVSWEPLRSEHFPARTGHLPDSEAVPDRLLLRTSAFCASWRTARIRLDPRNLTVRASLLRDPGGPPPGRDLWPAIQTRTRGVRNYTRRVVLIDDKHELAMRLSELADRFRQGRNTLRPSSNVCSMPSGRRRDVMLRWPPN